MVFTIQDYHDLVQLLAEHPEWQLELRRLLIAEDLQMLSGIVRDLAEAQRRAKERLSRLEETVAALAEAQRRAEERLSGVEEHLRRLEETVAALAEAQRRTDERLAAFQQRTDERFAELAEAQRRTERALKRLSRQVGGLSDTVGGDIEDIAYIVLHDVLKREFGWQVGVLERTWQTWDGQPEEVNVFGRASDPARPERVIWIVGEAKHNLATREVERFIKQVERARRHLEGEVFAVCFCYRARPEVQQMVRDAGLRLVFSYGKLV